jgi:hypothetical protein
VLLFVVALVLVMLMMLMMVKMLQLLVLTVQMGMMTWQCRLGHHDLRQLQQRQGHLNPAHQLATAAAAGQHVTLLLTPGSCNQ